MGIIEATQRAVIDGKPNELETKIAISLWHRFGQPSIIEWEDETHKAEFIDAAITVLHIAGKAA